MKVWFQNVTCELGENLEIIITATQRRIHKTLWFSCYRDITTEVTRCLPTFFLRVRSEDKGLWVRVCEYVGGVSVLYRNLNI